LSESYVNILRRNTLKKLLYIFTALTLLTGIIGCSSKEEESAVLIAAAASLKGVLEEDVIPAFKTQYPNISVEATFDSSGKLQTQIEEGLEADIFFSAATKQMDALTDGGFIDKDSVVELLENALVLIVPDGSTLDITTFSDITKADTIALGDPASVPAGQYAQEVLTGLGVYDEALAKASLGSNVTEVLNSVAEASADAGIVYATDAASMTDKVKIAAPAPDDAPKVIYPVGITAASKNKEAAENFIGFLKEKAAMDAFIAKGFKANN
jgi:molybdate transport system substrate-binding protein